MDDNDAFIEHMKQQVFIDVKRIHKKIAIQQLKNINNSENK